MTVLWCRRCVSMTVSKSAASEGADPIPMRSQFGALGLMLTKLHQSTERGTARVSAKDATGLLVAAAFGVTAESAARYELVGRVRVRNLKSVASVQRSD
jgi:hypothetical protein